MKEASTQRARLDGIAVLLSGTCMVHCLVLPLLVTVFPIIQGSLIDEAYFHILMLFFILPTSLVALTIGCRKHRDPATIVMGGVGLTVLALTAIFGHAWFGFAGERIVTTLGGLILAASHIRNFLLCRSDDCTHDHGDC
ncbi:MAG: MerC domain-containing protein [Pseudomonadota bacterium]